MVLQPGDIIKRSDTTRYHISYRNVLTKVQHISDVEFEFRKDIKYQEAYIILSISKKKTALQWDRIKIWERLLEV